MPLMDGEEDGETGAFVGFGTDLDFTIVFLDDFVGNS